MVQGLAFLSKKSWHTKNLANQEKVWMAEQQKAAEDSKTKELARQIQQEREQEELDKIAGRKSSRLDRGIDWMYQGGTGGEAAKEDAEKKAEEFLLGKQFVPDGGKGGDFATSETDGVNAVVSNATEASSDPPAQPQQTFAQAAAEPSVAERNEAFRLRHEDPMFLVSRRQREQKEKVEMNRAIYERVVGSGDRKRSEDEGHRKRKSRKSHRRNGDDSEDSDHYRKRRDHKERERGRKRYRDDDDDDRRSRNRYRSDSRDRYLRSDRRTKRSRRSHRSPSFSPEERSYPNEREESRYRRRERDNRNRPFRRSMDDSDYPRHQHNRHEEVIRERKPPLVESRNPKYGLQGPKGATLKKEGDLGPDSRLLETKRRARDEERRKRHDTGRSRRPMSREEREKALQDMKQDATHRDAFRSDTRKVMAGEESVVPSRGTARFLNDLSQRTHGIR